MVQLRDIDLDVFCLHVWICELPCSSVELAISCHLQAQLIPQLIINYKLKVWRILRLKVGYSC